MKTFLIAAICFFVILALLFVYIYFVENTVDELISDLNRLYGEIVKQSSNNIEESFFKFYKKWEKEKKILSCFMEQSLLESVSENLFVLASYIENGNYKEAAAKINTIRALLYQLAEGEKPNWVNILGQNSGKNINFS